MDRHGNEQGKNRVGAWYRRFHFWLAKKTELYGLRQDLKCIEEEKTLGRRELENLQNAAGNMAYRSWEAAQSSGEFDHRISCEEELVSCFIKIHGQYEMIKKKDAEIEEIEEKIRQVKKSAWVSGTAAGEPADSGSGEAIEATAAAQTAATVAGISRVQEFRGCVCPQCKAVYKNPAKFCRRCGARIAAEEVVAAGAAAEGAATEEVVEEGAAEEAVVAEATAAGTAAEAVMAENAATAEDAVMADAAAPTVVAAGGGAE